MTGQLVGYARVSSVGQSLEDQEQALTDAGCTRIFSEKRSGTEQVGREELWRAVDYVRDGDTFLVTRIDRLARHARDLNDIVDRLTAKGVGFKALQQGEFDTTTAMGKMVLGLLGLFAEFEWTLIRERTQDGVERAKAKGRYKGRKPTIDRDEIRRLHAEGMKPAHIARELGIGRTTVHAAIKPDDAKP